MAQYRSSTYLYMISIIISIGGIYGSIIGCVLNASMLQVESSLDWEESQDDFRMGMASSLLPLGGIFGALTAGFYADSFGRRLLMMNSDGIVILSFWLTYYENFYVFCAGRALEGYAGGVSGTVAFLYLRELSPPEISGRVIGISKVFSTFGLVITYGLAFGLPLTATPNNHFWEFMFGLPAILAAIRLVFFFTVVTFDSPRYYFITSQEKEARAVIEDIYLKEYVEEVFVRESVFNRHLGFRDVFSSTYSYQLLICLFVGITTTYMGLSSLNNYSTIIFLGTTDDNENPPPPAFVLQMRILNLAMGLTKVLAAVVGSFLIDKFGRRSLILVGNIIVTITLYAFAVFGFQGWGLEQRLDILLLALASGATYGISMAVYVPEVLPSKGVTVASVVDGINQVIITFLFPILADTPEMIIWAFVIFGTVGLLSAPVLWLYFKETKNLRLHDIYSLFQSDIEMANPDKEERQDLLNKEKDGAAENNEGNVGKQDGESAI